MKKAPGFSMIEMLAVVALVIVVAGISVAGVNSFGRYKASTDLGSFNSFLRYNFMQAVRNNYYLRIAIDMETGKYWSEKSETPFFLSTGEKYEAEKKEKEEMIERMESGMGSDPFENTGAGLSVSNIMEKARLLGNDDLDNSDYFNYENFIPDRRSLKQILKPEFETVSEVKNFSDTLIITGFFAYHTSEIITRDIIGDNKMESVVHIYIFPEGRIEPFYLSLGEETDEGEQSFAYISSDMFINTKISSGGFEDVVTDMMDLFEDQDAEGKS